MKVADFDYALPKELIAQEPLDRRDASRLLVLYRQTGVVEHRRFADLPSYINEGDLLVFNDSKVIRARLQGRRQTGGSLEVFLLRRVDGNVWEALVKPGRKALPGTTVSFGQGFAGTVLERTPDGVRLVRLESSLAIEQAIERWGAVPLPPYIKKPLDSPDRYQTVYATEPGSVAAPTAGLHFTEDMMEALRRAGATLQYVTLHVGLGTFRPVRVEDVERHVMHEEHYHISPAVAAAIVAARAGTAAASAPVATARARSGRVIAVGTTVVRTLESVAREDGTVASGEGWTSLFVFPGYRFRVTGAMLTNFHLPKSTLLMMVCAFAGRDKVMRAYGEAIEQRYRFFSFGDAMLVVD
ncbi:MAG: tRNA preQ1(34) S-adenosylmethionine ribosyltransferase-isomerase QueA [Bacillota bacterium]|nr:tRNA preQ1(34) S-adenosylmethionine ribosyltransferase-isomerase QueA [Bacillota bacterium]